MAPRFGISLDSSCGGNEITAAAEIGYIWITKGILSWSINCAVTIKKMSRWIQAIKRWGFRFTDMVQGYSMHEF